MQLISHLIVKSIAALIKFHWVSTTWCRVQVMRGSTESSATPDLSVTQLRWNVSDDVGAEWSRPLYALIGFGIILKSKPNHQKNQTPSGVFTTVRLSRARLLSQSGRLLPGLKLCLRLSPVQVNSLAPLLPKSAAIIPPTAWLQEGK